MQTRSIVAALVACAARRTSSSPRRAVAFALLALLGGAALLVGCDAKADKDACAKMVEHDYGILDQRNNMSATEPGKKILEELKAKTMEGCVGKMTMSTVECHMKAPTPADMSKCDGK
jgi:hypothetical protein